MTSDVNKEMHEKFQKLGGGAEDVFHHLMMGNNDLMQEAIAEFDGDSQQLLSLIEEYKRKRGHGDAQEGWEDMKEVWNDGDKNKSWKRSQIADYITTRFSMLTPRHTEQIWYFTNPVYVDSGEQHIREQLQTQLGDQMSTHDINEIIDKVKFRSLADTNQLDRKPHLIPLQNGVYNIQTGELEDPDPDNFLTNELPVHYDPDADCPEVKEFIEEIVTEENVPVLQELIGYCMYRDYPIAKAFMLLGSGENGKSTFLNLLEAFLGDDNVANPSLHDILNGRGEVDLYRKLANVHGDLSDARLHETGMFKKLTGQDTIYADPKYQQPFEFQNYATLVYSANELPATEDTTDAFFRRWVIIEFPYKFTTKDDEHKDADPQLMEKLTTEEELSGLFNWAVKGLQRVLENDGFTTTSDMQQIKEEWLTRTNPLQVFVDKHVVEDTAGGYITKEQFYQSFKRFCEYYSSEIPTKQKVGQEMSKLVTSVTESRPSTNNGRQVAWANIRLHEDCEFLPEHVGETMQIGEKVEETCDMGDGNNEENENVTDVKDSDNNYKRDARVLQKGLPKNVDFSDVLSLYPDPSEGHESYPVIEGRAEDELGVDGETFYRVHEKLQDEGDIFSPKQGEWQRV